MFRGLVCPEEREHESTNRRKSFAMDFSYRVEHFRFAISMRHPEPLVEQCEKSISFADKLRLMMVNNSGS